MGWTACSCVHHTYFIISYHPSIPYLSPKPHQPFGRAQDNFPVTFAIRPSLCLCLLKTRWKAEEESWHWGTWVQLLGVGCLTLLSFSFLSYAAGNTCGTVIVSTVVIVFLLQFYILAQLVVSTLTLHYSLLLADFTLLIMVTKVPWWLSTQEGTKPQWWVHSRSYLFLCDSSKCQWAENAWLIKLSPVGLGCVYPLIKTVSSILQICFPSPLLEYLQVLNSLFILLLRSNSIFLPPRQIICTQTVRATLNTPNTNNKVLSVLFYIIFLSFSSDSSW